MTNKSIFFLIINLLTAVNMQAMLDKQKAISILQRSLSTNTQTPCFKANDVYSLNKLIEKRAGSFCGSTIGSLQKSSKSQLFTHSQFLADKPFINTLNVHHAMKKNNRERMESTNKRNIFDLISIAIVLAASGTLGAIVYDELNADINKSINNVFDTAHGILNIEFFDATKISGDIDKSVVKIKNEIDDNWISLGSGTIIKGAASNNYYLITAKHCIDNPLHDTYILLEKNMALKAGLILSDKYDDIAILMIKPGEIERYFNNIGKHLPAISSDLLSNNIPENNTPVVLKGYPGFLPADQQEPYSLVMATKEEKRLQLFDPILGGLKLVTHKMEKKLNGASGGPIVSLINNQPHVIGIVSHQQRVEKKHMLLKQNIVLAAGVGDLKTYFERAEKMAEDKIVKQ